MERLDEMRIKFSKENEPQKGNGSSLIRFQMPNGTKIDRRFLVSDSIEVGILFLDLLLYMGVFSFSF